MYRAQRGAAGAVALLAAVGLSYGGCSTPYIGGECAANADCQSEFQNLPGSGCVSGRCTCLDPSHHICCERGDMEVDCFLACRPCDECAVGTEGCPEPGCESDDECPGPPDVRCGEGRCVQGECQVEIRPGAVSSQRRGDCEEVHCSATGEVISVSDPSDFYNDGEQCTSDTCGADGPRNEPLVNGAGCPVSGAGRCWEGECVDCWFGDPSMNNCPAGYGCDGTACVPLHCVNNQIDGGETDYDCGGPCRPCPPGDSCVSGADCRDGICATGLCKFPMCTDGVHNDAETGLDCGAPSCPLCPAGEGCLTGDDCESGVCWAGICEAPSCFDGVRNDDEAGIDCGPVCDVSCP